MKHAKCVGKHASSYIQIKIPEFTLCTEEMMYMHVVRGSYHTHSSRLTSCVYKCAFPVHVDFIDMSVTITEFFLMLKISRTTVLTIHNGICVIYIVFALMLPHSCAVLIFLIMMLCGVYDLIQVGNTAFHHAARNGHIKVVDHLLSLQPNINITNNVSQFIVL